MKKKGSMTVFLAMILVLTETLLFALGEYIRIYELKSLAQEYTDAAVESAFSEYNTYLWANYQILAIDLGYGSNTTGTAVMQQRVIDFVSEDANPESGLSFNRLTAEFATVDNYSLLTDNGGNAIVSQGVTAAKTNLADNILDLITDQLEGEEDIESVDIESIVEEGTSTLNQAKEENAAAREKAIEERDPNHPVSDIPVPEEVEDNPLDVYARVKESMDKGAIYLVLGDTPTSAYEIEAGTLPSSRSLQVGNKDAATGQSLVDRALYTKYLLENMSYYGSDLEHDGFSYELEYLANGQSSDQANLASTIEKLMLVREAANYGAILKDTRLRNMASTLATTLTSFCPAAYGPVELAIIGAWAYMESILDIRLLLAGGKVAVIKNYDQWTVDVWNMTDFVNKDAMANNCENGLTYRQLLTGMLVLIPMDTLGIRTADILEDALNTQENYGQVRLDNMLSSAEISVSYSASPLFLNLFSINQTGIDGYSLTRTKNMEY